MPRAGLLAFLSLSCPKFALVLFPDGPADGLGSAVILAVGQIDQEVFHALRDSESYGDQLFFLFFLHFSGCRIAGFVEKVNTFLLRFAWRQNGSCVPLHKYALACAAFAFA